MITLENILTKKRVTKTNVKANAILKSEILGKQWKKVGEDKEPAPPEVKEKVSISTTQEKKKKSKKQINGT